MTTILVVGTLVLGILHYLYPEHRKNIRIPIVILIGIILLTFVSPWFDCAINMSPTSLMTFDWEVISFQHKRCLFADDLSQLIG